MNALNRAVRSICPALTTYTSCGKVFCITLFMHVVPTVDQKLSEDDLLQGSLKVSSDISISPISHCLPPEPSLNNTRPSESSGFPGFRQSQ